MTNEMKMFLHNLYIYIKVYKLTPEFVLEDIEINSIMKTSYKSGFIYFSKIPKFCMPHKATIKSISMRGKNMEYESDERRLSASESVKQQVRRALLRETTSLYHYKLWNSSVG